MTWFIVILMGLFGIALFIIGFLLGGIIIYLQFMKALSPTKPGSKWRSRATQQEETGEGGAATKD